MAVFLSPVGGVAAQFFDNNGSPLSGGKLYTYSAGTTTPAVAYTTSLGNVAWTNPIVLDAAGRVPGSGEIWLTDGVIYKFVVKDNNDVLIATYDNITGINSNFVNFTAGQEIQTATAGQTVFTLADIEYQPNTNSLSVFVDGVNQYGPGAQYAYEETDSTTVTFNDGLHVGASVKFTTATQVTGNATDASVVAYTPPFANSVTTTVENKLAEIVSVKDFGAVGDGVVDDSTAIQDAIDSGKSLYFPEGTYLAGNLTQAEANQRFYAFGNATIQKNANGVLLTSSGRDVMFEGIKFQGDVAFTGDCVKTTGDNVIFTNCSVWTRNGFALLAEGNGTKIIGTSDIYYSDDPDGYAICLGNNSAVTLYHQIVGITTSTSTGGILCRKTGASGLVNSQVGTVNLADGQLFISNTRITGDYIAYAAFNKIINSTISKNVTIGDGVTTTSGISFGPGVSMQAGKTITINKMRESYIEIGELGNSGVTIVDNLTGDAADIGNMVYFPPLSFSPVWQATVTSPSIGDGVLTGFYTRFGTQMNVTISLTAGATTTFGSGDWVFNLPAPAKSRFGGSASGEDSGTGFLYGAVVGGGAFFGDAARVISYTTGDRFSATVPTTWAANDQLFLDFTYTVDNT